MCKKIVKNVYVFNKMSVYMYNEIDFNKIGFSNKPYKKIKKILVDDNIIIKSIYYIDIDYSNQPLYVQIPTCKLENIENDIMTLVMDNNFYYNFIRLLEDNIIKAVYKNSERWFLGKIFTINKIMNCIVSCVEILDNGFVRLNVSYDTNLKLYDQYKNEICFTDIINDKNDTKNIKRDVKDVVCIMHIKNLQFIDNMFTYDLVMEQMKIYKVHKIIEYSIIDTESCSSGSSKLLDEYYKEK